MSNGTSGQEKLKIWLGFVQFILGTVALGLVATIINREIQHREIELKEQEQIGSFLEYALDANIGYRLRFAQYFATVTRSSDLRDRWSAYRDTLWREYEEVRDSLEEARATLAQLTSPTERDSALAWIDELQADLRPQAIVRSENVRPRVYFHIVVEEQRARAERAAATVRDRAFLVPGIELVASAPNTSQLRYFRRVDEAEANRIVVILGEAGLSAVATYIEGYESSTQIRPRHYELWLSNDAFIGAPGP